MSIKEGDGIKFIGTKTYSTATGSSKINGAIYFTNDINGSIVVNGKIYGTANSDLMSKPTQGELKKYIDDVATGLVDGSVTMPKLGSDVTNVLVEFEKTDNHLIDITNKLSAAIETWPDTKFSHTIEWYSGNDIAAVGATINWPTERVKWNPEIKDYNDEYVINYTKYLNNAKGYDITWQSQNTWLPSDLGANNFIMDYNYSAGEYTIESNIGNKKTIIVSAYSGTIKKTTHVTYPWYINETSYLTAINTSKKVSINLTGSPSIKIPLNSIVSVKANVGNGFNDVADWEFKDNETINGVSYKVYAKAEDNPYGSSTPHEITVTIKI